MRQCLRVAILAGCTGAALGQERPPEPRSIEKVPQVSLVQVQGWIAALDANRFSVREAATGKLIGVGTVCIAPLLKHLETSSLEASTRTIMVLRELAMSNELNTSLAAETALRKVSRTYHSASIRARDTLRLLAEAKQGRALESLQRLGAIIHRNSPAAPEGYGSLGIEIGPRWRGTFNDLKHLRWVQRISTINLVGDRIGDEILEEVSRTNGLRAVVIQRTRVTDRGVQALADRVKRRELKLQTLIVYYAPITDKSAELLKGFKGLRDLHLYGTNVSKPAAAQIEMVLGAINITHRSGGFLGVSLSGNIASQPLAGPCTVKAIVSGSAAMTAGLQEDDIILKYDGQSVTTVTQLIGLIGRHRVGDKVRFQALRGAETIAYRLGKDGDMLGIKGKSQGFGIVVTEVTPNSPAAKAAPALATARAGIQKGDLIFSWNDGLVHELAELEKGYRAEKVQGEILLLRGGEVSEKTVTLGHWAWPQQR